MNIIVFGPTGGAGRAVITKLLEDRHTVTAFARDPSKLSPMPGLAIVKGDAMNPADVKRAIPGHEAIVISLGNPQLPLAVSLGARRTTPADICEMGTRNIVAALGPGSALRVLALTAFGVGDARAKMSLMFKIMLPLQAIGSPARRAKAARCASRARTWRRSSPRKSPARSITGKPSPFRVE